MSKTVKVLLIIVVVLIAGFGAYYGSDQLKGFMKLQNDTSVTE